MLIWYADYFDVSMDYICCRTEKPQGRLYEFKPKILEEDKDMRRFVEMCFDPASPMNDRLKKTIVLIDKNALKNVLVAVGNHALELGPTICCAALRPVDIFANHDMSWTSMLKSV